MTRVLNTYWIEYIKDPSEEGRLAAVKQDAWVIRYIRDPSEKVQLGAVKQEGQVIIYIKDPSEKVQMEAVKQNCRAIDYIKDPSEEVRVAAYKNLYEIEDLGEYIKVGCEVRTREQWLKTTKQEISDEHGDLESEFLVYLKEYIRRGEK